MKPKLIILILTVLLLSGCLTSKYLDGKYIADNNDTITFTDNNIFYATEYMEFSNHTVEFSGTYVIVGDEVTLQYKFMGFVRRFKISNNNNTMTLTELNNGMQFNREST